jgi:hypothetical protein
MRAAQIERAEGLDQAVIDHRMQLEHGQRPRHARHAKKK